MSNFKYDVCRGVWMKGDDTCADPYVEIYPPCKDRVAAPDSYLLYFADAESRQFSPLNKRIKWLKFKTYRAAQQFAKGLSK